MDLVCKKSIVMCALVFPLVAACDSNLRSNEGPGVVDDEGQVDWRSLVDNAEEHNGFRFNGFRFNGFRFNGFRFNGFRFNGFRFNGEELGNLHMDGNLLCGEDSAATTLCGADLDGSTFDVDFVDPEDPNNTATLEFEISGFETTATGLSLVTVRHRELPSGDWVSSCDNDAKAVMLRGDWDVLTGDPITSDPDAMSFACLGGALGDCAAWGYIPGDTYSSTALDGYHEACTRLKRADYCGTGIHHTENGHIIDIYDDLGVQDSATAWPVEAMWGPDGAICSSFHRMLDYSSDPNSPIHEYVGCAVPECLDVNEDGVIDFLDYPTAIMTNRTIPSWKTRDYTVYTFYRKWNGLMFRRSRDGGNSFSPPKKITGDITEEERSPKVTVDESGNIHLVFVGGAAPTRELRHSISTDGGVTFSAPSAVSSTAGPLYCAEDEIGTSTEYRYEIVHDQAGNLHVFYDQVFEGVRRVLYVRSSDLGASWSTPATLDSAGPSSYLRNVIVDSGGNIHLLFNEQVAGLSWRLIYRKSSDGGQSWSFPILVNRPENRSFDADLALDSGDNPHIAYQESVGGASLLVYRKSVDGGSTFGPPSAVIDVANCGDLERCRIESVKLRLDSEDLPHIAYENHLYFDERLYYVNSSDGVTFNAPVAIDPTRIDNWHLLKIHFFLTSSDEPFITWQDMHTAPGDFAGYLTYSADGGASFSFPKRVTDIGQRNYEFDAVAGPDGVRFMMYSEYDPIEDTAVMYLKRSRSGDLLGPPLNLSMGAWATYPMIYIK